MFVRGASWYLLVTSLNTDRQKLMMDFPTMTFPETSITEKNLRSVLKFHGVPIELEENISNLTGNNPLEVRFACEAYSQGGKSVSVLSKWFTERVDFVLEKLQKEPDHRQTRCFHDWCAHKAADPRFFTKYGTPLFPAVAVAMDKFTFGWVQKEHKLARTMTDPVKFGRLYENFVALCFERDNCPFGWNISDTQIQFVRFSPDLNPSDLANKVSDRLQSVRTATLTIVVFWPDEDHGRMLPSIDFIYCVNDPDAVSPKPSWYIAGVQCCGCVHKNTYATFVQPNRGLAGYLRKIPDSRVEYVWLSHTQLGFPDWSIHDKQKEIFPPRPPTQFRKDDRDSVVSAPRSRNYASYVPTGNTEKNVRVSFKYFPLEMMLDPARLIPGDLKIWARQECNSDNNPIGSAFIVSTTLSIIDSLKNAIKVKWDANKATKLDALSLTIIDPDGKEVTDPGQPLKANTGKTPYLFKLPQ